MFCCRERIWLILLSLKNASSQSSIAVQKNCPNIYSFSLKLRFTLLCTLSDYRQASWIETHAKARSEPSLTFASIFET
ncbi:hypothetical protein K469DRAFT_720754 [Zopfia rhizophila CBS 207.26]|uniref:Secreted protein n=1 Tax=Zopfia rhizophila CBS 207.26 TaxID=1314779 RepID=A0A6A6DE51_9PEZI|nr:hypothetical protein K469DRAFT_720754 [Zopfia rhizophila CBS 207.26]